MEGISPSISFEIHLTNSLEEILEAKEKSMILEYFDFSPQFDLDAVRISIPSSVPPGHARNRLTNHPVWQSWDHLNNRIQHMYGSVYCTTEAAIHDHLAKSMNQVRLAWTDFFFVYQDITRRLQYQQSIQDLRWYLLLHFHAPTFAKQALASTQAQLDALRTQQRILDRIGVSLEQSRTEAEFRQATLIEQYQQAKEQNSRATQSEPGIEHALSLLGSLSLTPEMQTLVDALLQQVSTDE